MSDTRHLETELYLSSSLTASCRVIPPTHAQVTGQVTCTSLLHQILMKVLALVCGPAAWNSLTAAEPFTTYLQHHHHPVTGAISKLTFFATKTNKYRSFIHYALAKYQ